MSITLRVYNNGDHSCIVWRPDGHIDGCLGFALRRKLNGQETVLNNWVGFDLAPPGTSKPSTDWPFQRFLWWDYLLNNDDEISYRVVPMLGAKDNLTEAPDAQCSAWTEPERVTEQRTPHVAAFFNRGIVASQWVARALEEIPGSSQRAKMTNVISKPGNPLRDRLSGHLREEMLQLLADPPGPIFAALYELNDPELIAALKKLGKKANLVLGNGAFNKKQPDENAAVRPQLRSAINLFDRLVSAGHFAHNKFVVFCDAGGTPRRVWTGSTNWTVTGLCTQANNGLLIEDDAVAAAYKDAWDRIHRSGNGFPPTLVKGNSQPRQFTVDGGQVSVWNVPTDAEEDLDQARKLINGATHGILFLMFNPGGFQDDPDRWTLLQSILNRHQPDSNPYYNPSLYIHGVVNQPIPRLAEDPTVDPKQAGPPAAHELDPAAAVHPVALFQGGVAPPMRGAADALVPAAIQEKFQNWIPELKRESIAMVHSKVVVLDPFGEHPVVMTGSHNMGPKASEKNDDNLIIVENNAPLAQAYAVNIIAIYQNYQWRLYRNENHAANEVWSHLEDKDTWQDGHLQGWRGAELAFWLGLPAPAVAPAPPPQAAGPAKDGAAHRAHGNGRRPAKKPARRPARHKR
jgi:phosphatidylserine/phosphatidylglycerophosphate/cardiolipin synthase-like enzyme